MIRDRYTYLPISRQRKYQLRMKDKGKCIICGETATNAKFCTFHANRANEMTKKSLKKAKGVDNSESV